MFVHAVLFEIKPSQVKSYHEDNKMWSRFASQAPGFISYRTVKRVDYKNQFASIYQWEHKRYHDRFMGKFHDWLVKKSKAKVGVLGYFNVDSLYSRKKNKPKAKSFL